MKITSLLAIILPLIVTVANAEPRTALVDITKMRPYTTGAYFVTVSSNLMANGAQCHTVYKVNAADAGAKSVIASLLTAYSLEKKIQIEVPTATGCIGFGTPIASVFLN